MGVEESMRTAVVTDSNSGITREEAEKLGVFVLSMPFFINEELFYEEVTLSQEQFYQKNERRGGYQDIPAFTR